MIHFIQHIPGFGDGKPYEKRYRTVENMLKDPKIKSYLHYGESPVYAYGNDWGRQLLMISSTAKKWWWVIGYVDGVNLSDYLPYYEQTYLLKGKIPVVERNGEFYIVRSEENTGDMAIYSLYNLQTGNVTSWHRAKDYKFVRYATQEELDRINGVTSENPDGK